MAKLIPLNRIPYRARQAEARERAKWPTRAMALDSATIAIVGAPGCYGGAEAPTYGFVLTSAAAAALAEIKVDMPGGGRHRRLDYQDGYPSSDALGCYLEAVARDPSPAGREAALAAYKAARRDCR